LSDEYLREAGGGGGGGGEALFAFRMEETWSPLPEVKEL